MSSGSYSQAGAGAPSRAAATDRARRSLGRRGEQLGAEHLRRRGFALVARNARTRHGEIDLIAFDGRTLVFCEVKCRRARPGSDAHDQSRQPLAGVGPRKRSRLRRLAAAWLADATRSRPTAELIRFDAIGVTLDADGAPARLEHVEGAW